jgi:hypothetical protein
MDKIRYSCFWKMSIVQIGGLWRELWSYNLIVESDNLIWTGSEAVASGRPTSIGLICGFWREIHGVFV